jgi:CHAT domain-containing protein
MTVLRARFSDSLTLLHGDDATVARVLAAVHDHAWIHLACHGVQDRADPTRSAFLLHDRPLALSDLVSAPASVGELAFLSACETAAGDEAVPDEAVHLAAGMLAVGYKGVVGTTWAINDGDAPVVADAFYAALLGERRKGLAKSAHTGAAYALDEAIRQLRQKPGVGEQAFARWVPFVHFGI